ncbi:MAG: transposase [Symbiobacteriia bacterium]
MRDLQEYRRTHPNPNAPDAIDMALALWLHQSGDQAGASAMVQRALTAQLQHPYVPYLAVEEGLRQPAEVLGGTMNRPLRRWLQDRAGLEGEPPDNPVITLPERPDLHGATRHMLTYKAARLGMATDLQDEAYTSQTCPACGHRHKPSGREYRCACGFRYHRDGVLDRNCAGV